MWRCSHCDETVEDTFDVCWNCGESGDSKPDSDFEPETSDQTIPNQGKDADLETHPALVDEPMPSLCSNGMSRHEIAVLICKTLALILFAVAAVLSMTVVVLLISMLLAAPNGADFVIFLFAAVPGLAMVGIGVIYWTKSKWISSQMVPDDPRPVAITPFTIQDAMIVAFSTTGLFFFLEGIRETVRVAYLVQTYSSDDLPLGFEIWPPIIQLTLAFWFILGSRGIVGAIHWCRTVGIQQPEKDPKDECTE